MLFFGVWDPEGFGGVPERPSTARKGSYRARSSTGGQEKRTSTRIANSARIERPIDIVVFEVPRVDVGHCVAFVAGLVYAS